MNLQWQNILSADWLLSRTFSFLSVRDLRSLHAVNSNLKDSVDSFLNSLHGNFASNLGHDDALSGSKDNFRPLDVLISFLSMNDLSTLNQVSRGCRFSIRLYSTRLPAEVRRIVSTWSQEKGFAFLMHSFECTDRLPDSNLVVFHPPFLKLSLGSMAFDKESMKLIGQPLQEVQINGLPPHGLGRSKPFTCETDEPGVIFYCGGKYHMDTSSEDVWSWISRDHLVHDFSTTTALFDTKTGTWRTLPRMPEGRSGGMATRVGKRVYIFSGAEPTWDVFGVGLHANERTPEFVMVFDLEQEQWITSHGIDSFPGGQFHQGYGECHGVTSFGADIIVVSKREVFRLNTNNGQWAELPPLPMKVGVIQTCRVVIHHSTGVPMFIAFGKKTWAQIALTTERTTERWGQDRQWDITPDLRDYDLKVVRLHKDAIQLFSGNSWELMKSQNNAHTIFYGGYISSNSSTLSVVGHSQG